MKRFLLVFVCLLLGFFYPCIADDAPVAAKLQLIELKQRSDHTILIFTLKNNTQPRFFTLANPDRLVIDMPNTTASSALPKNIQQSNGLIQRVRLGVGPQSDTKAKANLRVVIDLAMKSQYIYLVDRDAKKKIQKITIILNKVSAEKPAKEPSSIEDIIGSHVSETSSVEKAQSTLAKSLSPQDLGVMPAPRKSATRVQSAHTHKVIVMIDPGHGGKDSGAIGPTGKMEKNIVLSISKKVQKLLNAEPGIDARLTRKGDYFIPLRQRLNLARANKANIFMAIHADAFKDTDARGASVFALSEHGATSEAARWLAERENTSELSGIMFKDKDRLLKSVLLDMSQTATIQDSLRLGGWVLKDLRPITPLHANRVEQAGFVVLKSPDIPSVLVETGFVTNPEEEKLLTSSAYQDKIAQALANGVTQYFKQNPPPDTWFEMEYKGD